MDENLFNQIDYDLDRICRSCLNVCDNAKSVFEVIDYYNSRPLNEIIMCCAQVQIHENDGMPNKLCSECTQQVNTAYMFKIKCEQSDNTLRAYIHGKNPDRQIKMENDYHMPIKPEITLVEDDPLHAQNFFADSNSDEFQRIDGLDDVEKNYINENDEYEDRDFEGGEDDNNDEDNEDDEEDDDDDEDDDDGGENDYHEPSSNKVYYNNQGAPVLPTDFDDSKINYKEARNADGRYNCPLCEKTLCDAKGLKLHIRLHTGKNLKRCCICNRGFTKQNHLNRHMDVHKVKIYKCTECDESFPAHEMLKTHMTTEHNITAKKKAIKDVLNMVIEGEEIDEHKEKHCLCKICDTTFDKIAQLRDHLGTHTDPNTYTAIDLQSKLFLFDLLRITPNVEDQDSLAKFLISEIQRNSLYRFYQITTPTGYELHLSDSESEDEEMGMDNINEENDRKKRSLVTHLCQECGKGFNRAFKINRHIKEEHPDKGLSHVCIGCSRKFATELLLSRHLERQCENKLKQHSCSSCKLKFMWQQSYDMHNEKFHSGRKVRRPVIFDDIVPKKRSHRPERPREKCFHCDTCSKSFFRQEHLERHKKIHLPSEKKFDCTVCQKKFNRKDNLRSHMRIHSDKTKPEDVDSKHLCVYCGRSFSNSSNLIVHMRRHTGEKPYKCDLCDKGFPRSSDLQCHRRTHTGEKPCLCTICGKGFSRSNKLVRHMRIHTGVRPYKCSHCDRAFTQSNDLTLHIRRHTGEKPYVCGICGDRFIQGTALAAHRRMQGHYEENQPAPFASISVNNPSRFTNANRVNRIGFIPPPVKQQLPEQISTPLSQHQNPQSHLPLTTVIPGPKREIIVPPHTPTVSVSSAASSPNPSSLNIDIGSPNSNSMHTNSNSMTDHGTFPPHRLPPHLASVQTPHGLAPFMTPNGVQFLSHLDVSTTVLSLAPFNHPNFN